MKKNRSGRKKFNIPGWGWSLLSLACAYLLWTFISSTEASMVFAPPQRVFAAMIGELERQRLFLHIWVSLRRSLSGFGIAFVCALPIAFLIGWYKPPRAILEPWIKFVKSIPPIAYIPLVVVGAGIGERSKIIVTFIGSFLLMVINTYQGVRNVDMTLLKAAKVLGASDLDIFVKVVIPASTPYIFVGMRIGMAASLTALVAAELTGAQSGVGQMISMASNFFRMELVLLYIIVLGVMGFLLDRVLSLLEWRLTGWQEIRNV